MRAVFVLAMLLVALDVDAASRTRPPGPAQMAAYAQQLLHDTYPADGPGAAVLVARGGQVLYRGARGLANVELGVPLSPDHVFQIGSVTKQFTAAAVLKLVEAGKLSLDDPLSNSLPDYPNATQIQLRQLLNHTSGIKSYTDLPEVMGGTIRLDRSTAELIATFKDQPTSFAPGTQWTYNNSGYVLLGAVLEAVSGTPWHAQLQHTVLDPSGLKHTVYGARERLIPLMTSGYTVKDGALAPAAFMSMTQAHAAGALVSTLDDLHAWNLALHDGALLGADAYAAMTTPGGAAIESGYGFGLVRGTLRGHLRFEHGGGIFGYATDLVYVPDARLSVVVLQNADATINGKGDPQRIAALLGAFALGDPYQENRPIKVALKTLEAAQGVYRMDADNVRILRVVDGQLTAQRGGNERLPLVPIAVDRFLYDGSLTWLQLERAKDGTISGLRIVHDGEGDGEFTPRSDQPLPLERRPITLDKAQRERLLGDYRADATGMRLFVGDDGNLKTQLDGQPALEVFAETPSRLFLTVVDATLDFAPESGPTRSVTLRQGGAVIVFKRVD